jgi:hypothetical protein
MKAAILITKLYLDDGEALLTILWELHHEGVVHGTA